MISSRINTRYFGDWQFYKAILLAIFISLCFAWPLHAEVVLPDSSLVFNVRESQPRKGDEFQFSSEIEDVVESRVKIYRSKHNGKPVYVMEKEDRTPKNDRVIWTFLLDTEQLGLVYLQKKMINKGGKTASDIWYDYENTMFGFPKNLCYMYTIPTWLMGKDLKPGASYDFYILLSYNGVPMHMSAIVKSVTTRTVPAGKFDCYLIKLEPDLDNILGNWKWAKSIIGPWVPNYYFWLDKRQPHLMVRFEGKFGPVGAAPTQTYELVTAQPK